MNNAWEVGDVLLHPIHEKGVILEKNIDYYRKDPLLTVHFYFESSAAKTKKLPFKLF